MPLSIQRAAGGEIAAGNASTEWTSEGAVKGAGSEYSATLQADVNCRGYAGIPLRARVIP